MKKTTTVFQLQRPKINIIFTGQCGVHVLWPAVKVYKIVIVIYLVVKPVTQPLKRAVALPRWQHVLLGVVGVNGLNVDMTAGAAGCVSVTVPREFVMEKLSKLLHVENFCTFFLKNMYLMQEFKEFNDSLLLLLTPRFCSLRLYFTFYVMFYVI